MLTSALECFSFFERPASVGLKMSVKMTEQDRNERLIRRLYLLARNSLPRHATIRIVFLRTAATSIWMLSHFMAKVTRQIRSTPPTQVKMQQPFVGTLMSID
jgi:hypothetical protein